MLLLAQLACDPEPIEPEPGCWTVDIDGDGAEGRGGCDPTDCDDANPRVYPGADEHCDGADEDCDGDVDEHPIDPSSWFTDGDGDGYGAAEVVACSAPEGAVVVPGDCEDGDASRFPGAPEHCDGVDEDCDGVPDDAAEDMSTWFVDEDADGFGSEPVLACVMPDDAAQADGDCDDSRADVAPDAEERCDEADNDCDGILDEEATDAQTWFADGDGDGFGALPVHACAQPAGASFVDGDCDDADATTFPGAPESCDAADHDCDGDATAGALDPATWYDDADGDGFGAALLVACDRPEGAVEEAGDCDDDDPSVAPGAVEHCDARDEDCDDEVDEDPVDQPTWYTDADGDGYAATPVLGCTQPSGSTATADDCDDGDPAAHPGAFEVCDLVDEDCDGAIDNNADDAVELWADADGDGFGDPRTATEGCPDTPGFVENDRDCDDTDPTLVNTCPADCSTLVTTSGDVSFYGAGAGPDMAEFCTTYNAVAGDLSVSSVNVDDLRHLSCLCEVSGSVDITYNAQLVSLSGLDGLQAVGGDLLIQDNSALDTLSGLGSLVSVTGALDVLDNPLVADFTGLGSVESVGSLTLGHGLISATGLDSLRVIDGDLAVTGAFSVDGLVALEEIGGALSTSSRHLADLRSLSGVRAIGKLSIESAPLTSLAGLEGVASLPGGIDLDSNGSLNDISALAGVTGAIGSLRINDCGALTSLHGLEGITSTSSVYLSDVDALADLSGLDGLARVDDSLTIDSLERLLSLQGLEALEEVGGALFVSRNTKLQSLTGLDALRGTGNLTVSTNTVLESVDGLGALLTVDGDLLVSGNTALASLAGLASLSSVAGDLDVSLTSKDYAGLTSLTEVGGDLEIDDGSAGLEGLTRVGGELYLRSATCEGLTGVQEVGELYVYYVTGVCELPALTTVEGALTHNRSNASSGLAALRTAGSIDVPICDTGTTSFEIFPNIEEVLGDLLIEDCSKVASMGDFGSLRRVDGVLTFDNLDALTALPDLPQLRVTGGLQVSSHKMLYDLNGLAELRALHGPLTITSNSGVVNLTPLYGIGSIDGDFYFSSNTLLTQAEAEALRDVVGVENVSGTITISE